MVKQYTLPDLPYAYEALEPVISREIMQLHHDKHHAAYVNGANAALKTLEEGRQGKEINVKAVMRDLSFNLNGHLMHSIFWANMRAAEEENEASDRLQSLLAEQFGSYEAFKAEFAAAGKAVEGSGWVALCANATNDLVVMTFEKHNLLSLVTFDPVLVLDVWEHAYYLDYKNDRGAYVDAFWKIVNWEDVEMRVIGD
ncbi:MAG: superoxide dismutase [Candidatus Dojkabacteria bacterium]|nr:MAG: superoxide dismutase [Candidatus Dojkabacteria bacterium]